MATEPMIPDAPPRRVRLRRFMTIVFGSFVLAAGAFYGWMMYRSAALDRDLRTAIAEVESTDPRWQIEQIEADRAKVPDAENSAILITGVRRRIRGITRNGWMAHDQLMSGLSPEVRLSDDQYAAMIDELEQVESAIGPVLALARYPRGRHAITIAADVFNTLLPNSGDCMQIQWLVLDSLTPVLIHDGNAAGALDACRATLNLGRPFGDEQWAVTQATRTRFARQAIRSVERVLGQWELPDSALVALQADFAAEAEYDPWTITMRGQCAQIVRVLEAV